GGVLRGGASRRRIDAPDLHEHHAAAALAADLLRLHDRDDRRASLVQRDLRAHERRTARHEPHDDDARVPHVLPAGSDRTGLGDGRAAHNRDPAIHARAVPRPRAPGAVRMNVPTTLPRTSLRTLRRPPVPGIGSAFVRQALLIAVGAVVAYPFYFMVSSSLKPFFEAMELPPTVFPHELHPENYIAAWNKAPWGRYFANTFFIAIAITAGELITSVLAAYAFARISFRGKA